MNLILQAIKSLFRKLEKKIDQDIINNRSDWEQNDENGAGYIKNRPFYSEEKQIDVLPVGDYYMEDADALAFYCLEGSQLVEGVIYTVIFDDIVEKRLAIWNDSNGGVELELSEKTKLEVYTAGRGIFFESWYTESGQYHRIGLSYFEGGIKQIDEKFIPDSVAKISDLEELQSIVSRDEDGNVSIYGDGLYIDNSDSSEKVATEKYFYDPKRYLVVTDEVDGYTYFVTTKNGNLVSYIQTQSIAVTTMPNKTVYADHEEFNPDGMVVTATGVDGSEREITNYTYDVVTDSNFIISYTELGITHTASISLTLRDFSLIDFDYTANEDGTYTLTAWKGTYNGEPSTRIIVPDSELIII